MTGDPSTTTTNNLDGLFEKFDKMQIDVLGAKGGDDEDNNSNVFSSDSDSEEFNEDDHFKEDPNKISKKHEKHTDLEERDKEDMEFPDEVDTPITEARKRFQKYRGIKSLKNCDWDPYENLPEEY